MSTRYQTTQYNRLCRVKSKLGDIYSRARVFHPTEYKLSAECLAVWQSADYLKLSAYNRGFVRGLDEGLSQDIWHNHVAWLLGPASGPTRQAHSTWTEEMSTLCRLPGQLYGGHFWTDDNGQPTAHVFTEYKPTN